MFELSVWYSREVNVKINRFLELFIAHMMITGPRGLKFVNRLVDNVSLPVFPMLSHVDSRSDD